MKHRFTRHIAFLSAVVGLGMMTSCEKSNSAGTVQAEVDSLKVGLIAYYPFNNSGVDESGNGNHGMVYNISSVSDRNGKANYAYHFDGATSYITVKDNQALRLNNTDYTLNTWVKIDGYNSSYGSIVICKRGTGSSNGWNYGFHGYLNSNNAVLGQTTMQFSGGTDVLAVGVKTLNVGAWYMLTTVYDSQKHQISYYINGTLDTIVPNMPTPNASTSSDVYIGSDNPAIGASGYYFKGSLDDLRIYGRALTQAQIQKLYLLTY